jgi:hypothetical protein
LKILTETLFKNACCGIQEAACDSVNCSLKTSKKFEVGLVITFFSKSQANDSQWAFSKAELRFPFFSLRYCQSWKF